MEPYKKTFCVLLLVLVTELSDFCSDGQTVVESAQNNIQKNIEKPKTLYDYQTRVVAYKDLIESKCLLEILTNDESIITQRLTNFGNKTDNKPLSTSNKLSKREIWRLAGQRILDFCRGFPTYLIQNTLPDTHNSNTLLYVQNDLPVIEKISPKRRRRRENRHLFVGKVRGQTQSQYLNFGGNGQPGKAEAESSFNGTKAVVSGSSGMGQAQSQSSPVDCAECLGIGFQDQTLQYGRGQGPPDRYSYPSGSSGPPRAGEPGYTLPRPGDGSSGPRAEYQPGGIGLGTGGTGYPSGGDGRETGYSPSVARPREEGAGHQPGGIGPGIGGTGYPSGGEGRGADYSPSGARPREEGVGHQPGGIGSGTGGTGYPSGGEGRGADYSPSGAGPREEGAEHQPGGIGSSTGGTGYPSGGEGRGAGYSPSGARPREEGAGHQPGGIGSGTGGTGYPSGGEGRGADYSPSGARPREEGVGHQPGGIGSGTGETGYPSGGDGRITGYSPSGARPREEGARYQPGEIGSGTGGTGYPSGGDGRVTGYSPSGARPREEEARYQPGGIGSGTGGTGYPSGGDGRVTGYSPSGARPREEEARYQPGGIGSGTGGTGYPSGGDGRVTGYSPSGARPREEEARYQSGGTGYPSDGAGFVPDKIGPGNGAAGYPSDNRRPEEGGTGYIPSAIIPEVGPGYSSNGRRPVEGGAGYPVVTGGGTFGGNVDGRYQSHSGNSGRFSGVFHGMYESDRLGFTGQSEYGGWSQPGSQGSTIGVHGELGKPFIGRVSGLPGNTGYGPGYDKRNPGALAEFPGGQQNGGQTTGYPNSNAGYPRGPPATTTNTGVSTGLGPYSGGQPTYSRETAGHPAAIAGFPIGSPEYRETQVRYPSEPTRYLDIPAGYPESRTPTRYPDAGYPVATGPRAETSGGYPIVQARYPGGIAGEQTVYPGRVETPTGYPDVYQGARADYPRGAGEHYPSVSTGYPVEAGVRPNYFGAPAVYQGGGQLGQAEVPTNYPSVSVVYPERAGVPVTHTGGVTGLPVGHSGGQSTGYPGGVPSSVPHQYAVGRTGSGDTGPWIGGNRGPQTAGGVGAGEGAVQWIEGNRLPPNAGGGDSRGAEQWIDKKWVPDAPAGTGGGGPGGAGTGVPGGTASGLGEAQGADDADSQVQATVQQGNNETIASAQAQGKFLGGTSQSQVSGTYSGSGSFSASAGSDDGKRGALTQVAGGKDGAQSSAQGRGGAGQSQVQVSLDSTSGDTLSSAQTSGISHGTQTQVRASEKGGISDAQANGPGATSSQAQIGFTPYEENETDNQTTPFGGGGTAAAQSGTYSGMTQTQIQGKFRYGIRYQGAAQAGSGSIAIRNLTDPSGFFKPINFTVSKVNHNKQSQSQQASVAKPVQISEAKQDLSPSETSREVHQINPTTHPPTLPPADLSDSDLPTLPPEYDDTEYGDYNDDPSQEQDLEEQPEPIVSSPKPSKRNLISHLNRNTKSRSKSPTIVIQSTPSQRQHIVLDPLENLDATVHQSKGDFPEDGMVLQPGQVIPGSKGYQIPAGFRGKVKSIANGPNTYAIGKNSQAQSVTLSPGSGRIFYSKPDKPIYGVITRTSTKNGNYGSGYSYQPIHHPVGYKVKSGKVLPNFVSVSKSEVGSQNLNTGKKTPNVYYTQSSSCGMFTNSCFYADGKRTCFPVRKTNPDGSPMSC